MDELICKSWSGNTPKIFDNTEKSATKDGISNITKGTTTAKTEERIFADTSIESIKSLMKTLKLTAQQAMEALSIPMSEQSRYLSKL